MTPSVFRPVADLNSPEQQAFVEAARVAGLNPDDPWIGGYSDYEWDHLRPLLAVYELDMRRKNKPLRVLEFGCNAGGSLVVMAALGADVTGIDVAAEMVSIANANVGRHGLAHTARAQHVADTRALPFADSSFDLVVANSVLEYVAPDHLDAIARELHRVTAYGAQLFICGTASRLAPREIHSGRWLVNYIPRVLDTLIYGGPAQRGLSPLFLAKVMRGRFVDVSAGRWAVGRKAIHRGISKGARAVVWVGRIIGVSPGWLPPNIELLLRRVD
jgi:SAM-dependent methyltransferase